MSVASECFSVMSHTATKMYQI